MFRVSDNFLQIALMSFFIVFSACKSTSIIGKYSNANPDKIQFAGKELTFKDDGAFYLNEWTDSYSRSEDEHGNIICNDLNGKGSGTYRINKDTIELHFTNNDFLLCLIKVEEFATYFDVQVDIKSEILLPFMGSTLTIENGDGVLLESGITNTSGSAFFRIQKESKPKLLKINSFGAQEIAVNILDIKGLGVRDFKQKRCMGYFANQAIVKMWYKTGRKNIQYKINDRPVVKLERVNK